MHYLAIKDASSALRPFKTCFDLKWKWDHYCIVLYPVFDPLFVTCLWIWEFDLDTSLQVCGALGESDLLLCLVLHCML
ncbi:Pentatricopeptide repeat-containing protein [Corchorus olitorius]|uniref:Pentatricopeptide repeat-containing protein n=1 Tax=Corchorus olitorius TaxID=93759 RepID=A0A1R3JV28_9ROSI|nr:Pentatricopeptide repeat-containing protein [Corchorus olitorius]